MIFKNNDSNFAFIICTIFILMTGTIMVFGMEIEYKSVGCFSCIFQEEKTANESISNTSYYENEIILER